MAASAATESVRSLPPSDLGATPSALALATRQRRRGGALPLQAARPRVNPD